MEFWSTDHYKWVYKNVLERTRDIGNIMFKYKLIPTGRAYQIVAGERGIAPFATSLVRRGLRDTARAT